MSSPSPTDITSAKAETPPMHGRLVVAALEILNTEGLEGVSLRAIARRAGVSHGAPLRHFASHADLLAEVAAYGFRLLKDGIQNAAGQLPPGSGAVSRLRAAGSAYVEVAVKHGALFGLMFRPDTINVDNARFKLDSSAAFGVLVHHTRAAQDTGWQPDKNTQLLAGVVWTQIHGLATLWAQGAFQGPVPDASFEEALCLALDMIFEPGATRVQ